MTYTTDKETDDAVIHASVATAAALTTKASEVGLDRVTEKPLFHAAFRAALADELGEAVLPGEKTLAVLDWQAGGRLGGF
ncbi:MAG TPA: hypothetical protein VHV52_01375, partial [Gaiellaceae bacterium]|nr:hypothetical protein [Gaiellaceae bacterium]